MKKTLFLTSLVASMVAMAGITGSVEGYNENEATFSKYDGTSFVAKKLGVKTKVKVNGTGFSFGGDFKAKDLELGKVKKADYLNHSSVWAKYELPEIKGIKSYVKATVEPKFVGKVNNIDDSYKFGVTGELEGQASYKYAAVKDLELEGKVAFKKYFKSSKNTGDYEALGIILFGGSRPRYMHSYELKGAYKGVKHLTLSAKPFVAHVNIIKKLTQDSKLYRVDVVLYGVELGTEYKMLNDKLTLTGKSVLAGIHDKRIDEITNDPTQKLVKNNRGYFVFGANAKYDYSVTDKFTVSPEANANLEISVYKPASKLVTVPFLTLTPKVSAEYKPTDTLTLKGSVEVPVKFGVSGVVTYKFKYLQTQLKTSLNLKYEWK